MSESSEDEFDENFGENEENSGDFDGNFGELDDKTVSVREAVLNDLLEMIKNPTFSDSTKYSNWPLYRGEALFSLR